MRFRAKFSMALAMILVGGCAAPHPRRSTQQPVWEDYASVVPSDPVFPMASPIESAPIKPVKPAPHANTSSGARRETWVPLQRWARETGWEAPRRLAVAPVSSYALQSTNGTLILHTGSHLAQWDGTEVRLGLAPQLIDGQPYVHTLDLDKTIEPLLRGDADSAFLQAPVIVIDPGHGGENAGTKSVLDNRLEKEFTLDWALRLQSLLSAKHCKVFLTRSNDVDLSLSNRVAFAAEHQADVFVSLHFNSAAPNETESGLETYCLTPAGLPSNITRGYPDEANQVFPNNAFDVQNFLLAVRVHRALLQVNGHHDRGIRRARFPGVLRWQQRAAILVEGGYLSSPQEAQLIEEPEYRQKLAEAVAKALFPPAAGANVVLNSGHAGSLQPGADPDSNSSGNPTQ